MQLLLVKKYLRRRHETLSCGGAVMLTVDNQDTVAKYRVFTKGA